MDSKEEKALYVTLLSKRLKDLRVRAGYSNYEVFAYDAGIGRAQYNRYENGQDIRYTTLMRICKALGTTPNEFFSEGFDELDDYISSSSAKS